MILILSIKLNLDIYVHINIFILGPNSQRHILKASHLIPSNFQLVHLEREYPWTKLLLFPSRFPSKLFSFLPNAPKKKKKKKNEQSTLRYLIVNPKFSNPHPHKLSSLYTKPYIIHSIITMTSTSLSINPALSPPFSRATTSSSASSSYSASVFLRFQRFETLRTKPSCRFVRGARFSYFEGPKGLREKTKLGIKASDMTMSEIRPEEEEEGPPLLDSENNSRPRRIALFVEPSPFAWVFACFFEFWKILRFLVSYLTNYMKPISSMAFFFVVIDNFHAIWVIGI